MPAILVGIVEPSRDLQAFGRTATRLSIVLTNGLSLAQDDPNGTGMTTLQDYIAGTNPTDPTSVFLAGVVPPVSPGGNVTLLWSAVAGRTYSVQYKDSLDDPVWQPLNGTPVISGNQGQFAVPANQPTRYYRIVVQ